MNTNTRILKFAALAALVAGSVPTASAAGLLGQRYVGATFDWVLFDENMLDNGRGVSLGLNQPLSSNIDLSLGYSYLDSGLDLNDGESMINVNASSQNLLFGATFHGDLNTFKPYGRVSLGWMRTDVGGDDENDGIYSLEAGVEVPAGAKASLTLYTSWSNTFDDDLSDNGVWNFGALAEFEVTSKWSVLVGTSIDEDSNWGISAGAIFRF